MEGGVTIAVKCRGVWGRFVSSGPLRKWLQANVVQLGARLEPNDPNVGSSLSHLSTVPPLAADQIACNAFLPVFQPQMFRFGEG